MKSYDKAFAEVVLFDNTDVIRTSGNCTTMAMENSAHGTCMNNFSTNTCDLGQSNGAGKN